MNNSRLVYSTETGRVCPACSQPVAACCCKAASKARPLGDGNIKVSRESKGRGGKTVTLVKGMPLDTDALAALGKQLRSAWGSGGTVKEGVIEIQGDHCDKVMAALQKQGYQPKRVGG